MEDITEASLMKEGGMTVEEIAAELGVPAPTVYAWLSSAETVQTVREHRDDQIEQDYLGGTTIAGICAKHSITQGTVYRVLHARNIVLRRGQQPLKRKEKDRIVQMYQAGHLVTVIRRETGRALSTIYAVLDEFDIPRRRGLQIGDIIPIPIEPG